MDDDIYLMNLDGTNLRQLTMTNQVESSPNWSQDGKKNLFTSNREGAFSIYPKDEIQEVLDYTNCEGCPGGNIEYVPEEMIKNVAAAIL